VAINAQDEIHLRAALALAEQGVALSAPNPAVGAVITDRDGNVVGTGSHRYDGLKHAEILAIEQAGSQAKDGTLYINLEPCCHTGRTGPCTSAVYDAGIRRVVAAMPDPNMKVGGRGFEQLRGAGVVVDLADGDLRAQAKRLNEAFAKYIQHGVPLVTLKAGMTLDGKIAPPPGDQDNPTALGAAGASRGWITSEDARAQVQVLRHQSDAILVGVGTVIADDPLLTDRTGRERRRPLLRVIVDSRLRLPLESRVVHTANKDVVVFCGFAEESHKRALEERGVIVEQLPLYPPAWALVAGGRPARSADNRPDMRALTKRLGEMEITSLLIEGGALINWAALSSGVVDKVWLFYSPKILAGTGSVPFASGEGFRHMTEAAQVKTFNLHRFGEDFALEGYLKDPYEPTLQLVPASESRTGQIYEGV
jgi:diaminohydroxyphosphoribosylaminopyrimidine deaminase / 5-amino-6-(5-phosphoribosylamino)uracil reductase